MTERLYYQDSYVSDFAARIVERRKVDGRVAVVLDATAFYPTGGGQPHDTGVLGSVPVIDVLVDDDGNVLHILDGEAADVAVQGRLDWERRFDHMQQHTGQHILSQAFMTTVEAETVGFHLGEDVSTIDLDVASLAPEVVAAAERLANQVTMDDRTVTARFVDPADLAQMPLRKVPTVDGPIRIVQVADYDWSPCGGTHVSSSGQVGLIKIARIERRRSVLRVYFVCGWRALDDYARKQAVVGELTRHLTTSEQEILPSVERLESEVKRLRKAYTEAQGRLMEHEIPAWIASAEQIGGMQIVRHVFDDCEVTLLRELARRLTAEDGVVALLAVARPRPQFVFAAAEGTDADMGELMCTACAAAGGRGGGRATFAQGGAPEGSPADTVLEEAVRCLGAR